jgi:hypothetical protein
MDFRKKTDDLMRNLFPKLVLSFILSNAAPCLVLGQLSVSTNELKINVDGNGRLTSLKDLVHGREYIPAGLAAPLLTIRCHQITEEPARLELDIKNIGVVILKYPENAVSVYLQPINRGTHMVFEIIRVEPERKVDMVIWGPYPTSISKTIGEIVGVVRDDDFAIGLQVLNVKTLGGYPQNDEGSDMSRGRVAVKKDFGSILQAYCIDRTKARKIAVWTDNFPNMPVPPIPGETVVGSKIALFGCPSEKALDRIGEIEVAEGLPHPLIDSIWAKKSPVTGRSYLIADFTETNIDELLEYTKRAGLMTLYTVSPFKSWGHYEIDTVSFPHGVEGMNQCTEKAKAMGIRLGAHTLTNFINTNDPYITPVPDPRLAKTGYGLLISDLDDTVTAVPVASPEYFDNERANWLHTVQIGDELITYTSVTDTVPYLLQDCQRGAFGTKPSPHAKGVLVAKLLDHPYKVFFPNFNLQNEIAENLAKRFNETGLSQMDFDGFEGCLAAGQGDFAVELFAKIFYDNLDHTVINGTSISKPFYWHINTYCNWGEPWYEGFRESMQEYRINNQELFERNYLPNMLGWYLLTATTSISDIEWMLARASGYNAGFALATDLESLRKNPDTDILLETIHEWENARLSKAFSDEQKTQLKNPGLEFHLTRESDYRWNLFPYHQSQDYVYTRSIRHSGKPVKTEWIWQNIDKTQPLQFKLKVKGDTGIVRNPTLEIDHDHLIVFPAELKPGESLLCEGTTTARIYDSKGRQVASVTSPNEIPLIHAGNHTVRFTCDIEGNPPPKVILNFKTIGEPESTGGN